ncbi:hypothetical protein B0H13DRAFT_2379367 [Mycena leptocephala]|nr:hypothetical protein B0H13DRAFT_2379367 [Mycena leptocephala]
MSIPQRLIGVKYRGLRIRKAPQPKLRKEGPGTGFSDEKFIQWIRRNLPDPQDREANGSMYKHTSIGATVWAALFANLLAAGMQYPE